MNDEERFTLIFELYHRRVAAYVGRRVPQASVSDVVAETFLAAWHKLDRLGDEPLPWLYRTAALEIAQRRRTLQRDQRLWELAAAAPWSGSEGDPADLVVRHDQWATAFGELGESDREVLRLMAWDDLEPREAAKVLGCTVMAYRVRLHRARRRLLAKTTERVVVDLDPTHTTLEGKVQP